MANIVIAFPKMEDAIGIHIRTGEQPEESVVRGLKTMMNKDYKYQ